MKIIQQRAVRLPILLAMTVGCFLIPACQSEDARITARNALETELAERQDRQVQSLSFYHQAVSAYDKNDLGTARACVQDAIATYDRNAQAWMLMGLIDYKDGKIYEAASSFNRASLLMPDRYEPLYNIGILLESFGRYKQAIESYQAALKLSPSQLEVMENLARCYIRMGTNLDEAKNLIDQALLTEQRSQWRQWLAEQSHQLSMRKGINP